MEDRQSFSVKGMVCNRCITVLKSGLEELSLTIEDISLGKVTVSGIAGLGSISAIEKLLTSLDFELVKDREQMIVEQIKKTIDEVFKTHIYFETKVKFSKLLSEELHVNYDSLSAVFSRAEGITLESYIINKRIDKIKEYLVYTDLSLTEIAYLTGYSSIFHLSRQFKEHTSFNPSHYRKIKKEKELLMKQSELKNKK